MSILIKDATIVTQNEKREILEGDILIQGNEIAEVGKINEKAKSVIDASNKIAIPGFVNTCTSSDPITMIKSGITSCLSNEEKTGVRTLVLEELNINSSVKEKKFRMCVSRTRRDVFDFLKEKKTRPFEYLDSLGLVHGDSIFTHASWVTKREIGIVGKKKATISSCPINDLELATGGICPIVECDEACANVTFGTEYNMFETMKMAGLLQRHHYWKADVLSAQRIFDYATINGAKALGFNSGSIEKGKFADIVLLKDLNQKNILENIIYSANPSNVSEVIIDGKLKK